jgi:hypothetical protein
MLIERSFDSSQLDETEKTADAGALVRLSFRGLQGSDRLWIQAAAYGPASPWSDGDSVAGLRRCADPR